MSRPLLASCGIAANKAIMDVRMKKILLYIGIGLLLLAVPATVFFVGQQRELRAKAAPATTLTLTPITQTVDVGTVVKLNVDIDPGANQVVSADIYITFDPTKFTDVGIKNGSIAPRILSSGIVENGTASIKLGAASNAQPITTRGTIAVVTLTAANPTGNFAPSTVQLASNTFVGGLNEPTANVLVGTIPAKITITGTGTSDSTATNSASLLATTLTPTLTPTLAASDSSPASPSALQILSPAKDSEVTTSQPAIQGKAPPGSTVTIVIHSSSEQTATVTADANGNWIYTPTTPLEPGLHSVVASAQTSTGATQTVSASFIVAGAGGTGSGDGSSESAVPISGAVETTLILVGLGVLFITGGMLMPVFIR